MFWFYYVVNMSMELVKTSSFIGIHRERGQTGRWRKGGMAGFKVGLEGHS